MFTTDDWKGLYGDRWSGIITAESFRHPAKFANGLIRHIYDHALEQGWIAAGSHVLDPFGGVGLGALYALANGVNWIGVELERHFVDMANGMQCPGLLHADSDKTNVCPQCASYNETEHEIGLFDLHDHPVVAPHVYVGNIGLFAKFSKNGATAKEIQGDSRFLSTVITEADIVIASPPFSDQKNQGSNPLGGQAVRSELAKRGESPEGKYGDTEGNLGNLTMAKGFDLAISSPPYADTPISYVPEGSIGDYYRRTGEKGVKQQTVGYSKTPENLGNLKEEGGGFDLAVSSPPFIQITGGTNVTSTEGVLADVDLFKRHGAAQANRKGYGEDEGQLQPMVDKSFDLAVSSPPYADQPVKNGGDLTQWEGRRRIGASQNGNDGYGKAEGQLAGRQSFWLEARKITDEVFKVLRPGGNAIWVVKNYVKDGEIQQFSDKWRQLCEASGFVTIHQHRAWVVEEYGEQIGLTGDDKVLSKDRKSFFRRLQEKKGSPRIDWESVICMVKQ